MTELPKILHVTAIGKYGPFLQIYGHHDAALLRQMEDQIAAYLPQIKTPAINVSQLLPNRIYLTTDGKQYYRSMLIAQKSMRSALMEFIDYGIQYEAPLQNVSVYKTYCWFGMWVVGEW